MHKKIINISDAITSNISLPARDTKDGYPFRDKRKVLRVNSSGICNLNCSYCFTNHAKKKNAMANEEIDFIFERLGENIFFIFTGVGDFFAGYQKEQRFLHNVLMRKTEIFLDANGVELHEFPELTDEELKKILFFDVSYHYSTMKKQHLLERWANNAEIISKKMNPKHFIFKTIFSLAELEIWNEILNFYTEKVYPRTEKPLDIILDEFDTKIRSKEVLKFVNKIIGLYPESVNQTTYKYEDGQNKSHYDVDISFRKEESIECPAGSLFFKIDVDGNILPCDQAGGYLAGRKLVIGSTKKRQFYYLDNLYSCPRLQGSACIKNWDNKYPDHL